MIDKIIKRLESSNVFMKCRTNPLLVKQVCIDIVKQVAEEGGWIKCSDRLPIKRIDENDCNVEFNVMIKGAVAPTTLSINGTGEWFDDNSHTHFKYDVIAWQPLPKPFKESD